MLPGRWSSSCGFCWVFSFLSFGGTTFLKNKPEKLLISCGCAQRFALFFLLACLFFTSPSWTATVKTIASRDLKEKRGVV